MMALFLAALSGRVVCAAEGGGQREVMVRARVTRIEPAQRCRIHWRWGGEGLGGSVTRGELTAVPVKTPTAPKAEEEGEKVPPLETGPKDRTIVPGEGVYYHYLDPGVWSPAWPLSTFKRARFITFTLQCLDDNAKPQDAEAEFEFSFDNKVIKSFTVYAPVAITFGLVIPSGLLGEGGAPTKEFTDALCDIKTYATRRAETLEALPWAKEPAPKLYAIITDCGGYGERPGYGTRTGDKEAVMAEYRALKQLGVNGVRGCPAFILEMIRTGAGIGPQFSRAIDRGGMGYPVPSVSKPDGGKMRVPTGAGCPYFPETVKAIPTQVDEFMRAHMEFLRTLPVHEDWALTVDEIGSAFDGAPEGKDHQGACPYCREAFRNYIKEFGLTPKDFGAPDWEDIRSTYGYNAKTYEAQEKEKAEARDKEVKEAEKLAKVPLAGGKKGDETLPTIPADELPGKKARKTEQAEPPPHRLSAAGWNLLYYYSRRFNNEASARLFTPLKQAFERENERKRQALERGETDTPAAKQPWVYCYALRGNTFLMGGHSLDFFDFYRYADNGFMYETSNRDPRVWQWDGYLCNVGRILTEKMGKRFGIYVKPHRGAPIQRMLVAASNNARLIYWYTYGPDWSKGDSFSTNPAVLSDVSRAAHMLAQGEHVLYESAPALPAEVAVVRPNTAEYHGNSASWENGKWVYTALMHAHIPTDPLDEGLLMSEDLSRYKVICISGSHIRRDVAQKLVKYVEAGGTLYTSGWGLAQDEACQPLDVLLPVFGLEKRGEVELWSEVPRYGAVSLGQFRKLKDAPPGARVAGERVVSGVLDLAVGREVLQPAAGTEVLAKFADGGAAVTRHKHGKGQACVVGFYPGLEYSAPILTGNYDMSRDFAADRRSFIAGPVLDAGVRPVVDASQPCVEGVLLKNGKTGALAVTLMNWAYRVAPEAEPQPTKRRSPRGLVAFENVKVSIRGAGNVKTVRSCALGQTLKVEKTEGGLTVNLPELEEGDILLLE